MEQLSFIAPVAAPPPSIQDTQLAEEFDQFKAAYPRRPNNAWGPAFTSFCRARRVAEFPEIMAGLARYQFRADPQFRPMAATWLNQRRWLCEAVDLATDPWGLVAWHAALPGDDALGAACYWPEALAMVLTATGWAPTERPELAILDVWCRDGFTPAGIAAAIGEAVAKSGKRTRLEAFDRWVRSGAHLDTTSYFYRSAR